MSSVCDACEAGPAGFKHAVGRQVLIFTVSGPQYFGVLTHYDGFGNILLRDTAQRITNGASYADIPLGWLMIRGDDMSALLVDPIMNPALQKEDNHEMIFSVPVDASVQ